MPKWAGYWLLIGLLSVSPSVAAPSVLYNLGGTDALWSGARGRIYIASNFAIKVVNPVTQAVESTYALPDQPTREAVSEDGEWLYVYSRNGNSLRRLHLPEGTEELSLTAPFFENGCSYLDEIAVAPGLGRSIAVSGCQQVAIFDDKVRRSVVASLPYWSPNMQTRARFLNSSSLLLSGYGLVRLEVTADGVREVARSGSQAPSGSSYVVAGGRVFTSLGMVWDLTSLEPVGAVEVPNPYGNSFSPTLRANSSEVWYTFSNSTVDAHTVSFDASTLLPKRRTPLVTYPDILLPWGEDGWAVLSTSKLTLLRDSDMADCPAPVLNSKTSLNGAITLDLRAMSILGDPERGVVYAATPVREDQASNQILVFDGQTGEYRRAFAAGRAIQALSFSQDRKSIVAVAAGGWAIAHFDRETLQQTEFWRPSAPGALYNVGETPGQPGVYAVTGAWGVKLVDKVSRLNRGGAIGAVDRRFAFSTDGSMMYLASESGDIGASVTSGGLTAAFAMDPGFQTAGGPLAYARGIVYSAKGIAWNAANGAALKSFRKALALWADPVNPALYTVDETSVLRAYDTTTMEETGRLAIPISLLGMLGSDVQLEPGSSDRLVLRVRGNLVWIPLGNLSPVRPEAAQVTKLNDWVQRFDIDVQQMVTADPAGRLLIIGSTSNVKGAMIFDPNDGAIVSALPLDRYTPAMAISADSAYAYLGVQTGGMVARLRLPSLQMDHVFPSTTAEVLAVDAAQPLRFAFARGVQTWVSDGSSTQALPFDGFSPICGFLAFGEEPGTLDCIVSSGLYVQMKIGAANLTITQRVAGLLGAGATGITSSGRFAASRNGTIVDLSTKTRVATLPDIGPVCLDTAHNRIYQIYGTSSTNSLRLVVHDINTGAKLGQMTIPTGSSYSMPMVTQLVSAGPGRLAVYANGLLLISLDGMEWFSAPTRTATEEADGIRSLSLVAGDLLWDANRQVLLATVSAATPIDSNQLASIDTVAGSYETLGLIGPDPGAMTAAADFSKVYIALNAGGGVVPFDLESRTIGPRYASGGGSAGTYQVKDLAVSPTDPNRVVVLKGYLGGDFYAQAIDLVDGGTLTQTVSTYDGMSVAFARSGESFYVTGREGRFSEYGLGAGLITGIARDFTAWEDRALSRHTRVFGNRAYQGRGLVVDLTDMGAAGRYPIDAFEPAFNCECAPVEQANRLYCAGSTSAATALFSFELDSMRPLRSILLPNSHSALIALEAAGTDRLAVATANRLYLVDAALLDGASPHPANVVEQLGPGALRIALPANDLWWDAAAGRLIASVPGRRGQQGNSLVVINPQTGSVSDGPWVGSEPGRITGSADGSRLFVALDGARKVCRVSLPAMELGDCTRLALGQSGGPQRWTAVTDLLAVPGTVDSFFAGLRFGANDIGSRGSGLTVIFDGSEMRSSLIDITASMLAPGEGNRLYGTVGGSGSHTLLRMRWDESGLHDETTWGIHLADVNGRLFYYQGSLYTEYSGLVLDKDGTHRRGAVPYLNYDAEAIFAADPSRNHLWVASSGISLNGPPFIRFQIVDPATLASLDYVPFLGNNGVLAGTACGRDCMAWVTRNDRIFIVRPSVILPNLK